MKIESATIADAQAIVSILASNKTDTGLFQEPMTEVQKNLADFLVARDANGGAVACLGLHRDSNELAEVYGVAVLPKVQGCGIGAMLMRECKTRAVASHISLLWLATVKPEYFSRYSFRPISRPTQVPLGLSATDCTLDSRPLWPAHFHDMRPAGRARLLMRR